VIIAAAIVVIVASGGSSSGKHSTASATSTVPLPQPSARIRLTSPTGQPGALGIVEVVRRGSNAAISIVGKGVPPNTHHDAYAVWLFNSPADAVRLGFVNPGVGKNGHIDTAGVLPANAAHYRELLITLETAAAPTAPGHIVLEGPLRGG
jgi:hypothetical protein